MMCLAIRHTVLELLMLLLSAGEFVFVLIFGVLLGDSRRIIS
jgi:hypothetical protein